MASRRCGLLASVSLIVLAGAELASCAAYAAPPTFSPAWFAAQRGSAAGGSTGGSATSTGIAAAGAQASLPTTQQIQQSLTNLAQAARAIAQMRNAQAQAQATAAALQPAVPNGLAAGGLQPAAGYNQPGAGVWQGVANPTNPAAQATVGGRTQVTVTQNAAQAILNWRSFNVGGNTTLHFDQSAGGALASSWSVLNRVSDPSGVPSQILGQITAPGQVYVINANGIIFGGGAQINTGALIAAAANLSDTQFINSGIYSAPTTTGGAGGYLPSFTGAAASVLVQAGAQIATNAPLSAIDAGGCVMLIGRNVSNAGVISTPAGQTILAAGSDFILRPGYAIAPGSTTPSISTTLGSEIDPVGNAVAGSGVARNSGLIQASTGDITLTGGSVVQAGVAYAITSTAQRGTIHLLTNAADPNGTVTLAPGSLTYVAPDDGGIAPALNAQRASDLATSTATNAQRSLPTNNLLGNQVALPDLILASRIEITAGRLVDFQGGSLTMAQGGQIAVSAINAVNPGAGNRILVEAGARLDVSGSVGVSLPASANTLAVDVQGYELRDAPVNRDAGVLNSSTVYVDARQLVPVAAASGSSGGAAGTRYYTPGGLLEVSGELANAGHGIGEWTSYAGAIFFSAREVVAQPGSGFNLAGGTVSHQAGEVRTSWLIGGDGRLYNVNTAPSDLTYTGIYGGFTVAQPRWNIANTYTSPLVAPTQIYSPGYTVGHDGGSFIISAPSTVFEGTINAGVVNGTYQNGGRAGPVNTPYLAATSDPLLLSQTAVPLGGSLLIGNYNAIGQAMPTTATAPVQAAIGGDLPPVAGSLTAPAPLPAALQGTALLSAGVVNGSGLSSLSITALGTVTVSAPITLAPGGQVSLTAPGITIGAAISARGGSVTLGNELAPAVVAGTAITTALTAPSAGMSGGMPTGIALPPGVLLTASGTIDTRGLWTNALADPIDIAGEAFLNGGNVSVRTTGGITLAAASLIDASAGGAVRPGPSTQGGSGGSITLSADDVQSNQLPGTAPLVLGGGLRAIGVTQSGAAQGGTLSIAAPAVVIGAAAVSPAQLSLPADFFQQGFSSYVITGYGTAADPHPANGQGLLAGVAVAAGTTITAVAPAYQFTARSGLVPTGSDPASGFALLLPPLYIEDPRNALLTQRGAASVSLVSSVPNLHIGGAITIAAGAAISVDPGAAINVEAFGQVTIDGTLNAPGGRISVLNDRVETAATAPYYVAGQSVWIGGDARLNAAAQAVTAQDLFGRNYGVVPHGGTITLGSAGGVTEADNSIASTEAVVFVRPGATVDASGAQAPIDPSAGPYPPANALDRRAGVASGATLTASDGGTIALSSYNGIYVDGSLRAAAGGAGAAGGTLSVTLETPSYLASAVIPNDLRSVHRVVISATAPATALAAGLQAADPATFAGGAASLLGQASFGAAQIAAGGFDNLSIYTHDVLLFDGPVRLQAGQSIQLVAGEIAQTQRSAQVSVAAPYVLVSGAALLAPPQGSTTALLTGLATGNAAGGSLAITSGSPFSQASPPCLSGVAGCAGGTLTVQADLIEVQNQVRFGLSSTITQTASTSPAATQVGASTITATPTIAVDYAGFNNVDFVSSGDIRFLPNAGNGPVTDIVSAGNISFTAAQLYPVTGARAAVFAGVNPFVAVSSNELYSQGVLSVAQAGGAVPAAPSSAYGQLGLVAATVLQGGVVRAPLGAIYLGVSSGLTAPTRIGTSSADQLGGFAAASVTNAVTLLPGSLTSVNAAGLSIPFGGTTDGVTFTPPANLTVASQIPGSLAIGSDGGVAIGGRSINVAPGATIDLSGGGVLAGAGFVSGRGGSTDTLVTPLGNLNVSASTAANADPIYAIVPGYQGGYAPAAPGSSSSGGGGGAAVAPGAQVTLAAGVPGLPAGTYTLLPSIYALQPGGFRVELGSAGSTQFAGSYAVPNGSFQVAGYTGIANTAIRNAVPTLVTLTPGARVRTYAAYDEESYDQFLIANAALFGDLTPAVPADAKVLQLEFYPGAVAKGGPTVAGSAGVAAVSGLTFNGTALAQPAAGGQGGTATVLADTTTIEITPGYVPTTAFSGISLAAPALDAIGASRLIVGLAQNTLGSQNSIPLYVPVNAAPASVIVRGGATLAAASVILGGSSVTLEPGAVIDTIGRGAAPFDASQGNIFGANGYAIVAASNGALQFLPTVSGGGAITLGSCLGGDTCAGVPAALYASGSLNILTGGQLTASSNVRYGAQSITLNVPEINIGSEAALASAVVPAGFELTQPILAALAAGNATVGAPPLQQLNLTASQSLNFYGTVTLNTAAGGVGGTAAGSAGNLQLVIATPAIYGYGGPGDVATLSTGTLIWSGVSATNPATAAISSLAPGPAYANGPGSGSGTLDLIAQRLVLGYPADALAQSNVALDRSVLGFANVTLTGTQEITANNRNTLTVYQSRGAFQPASLSFAGSGGNLTLTTPLLTGGAGSTVSYTAGGGITIAAPIGSAPSTAAGDGLGAEIDLTAASIASSSAIALPSGKLAATAGSGDVSLGAGSRIDLAGPAVALFDQTEYAPGGNLVLEAKAGNVVQDAQARIDVSALGSNAGTISATALNGAVSLNGSIGGGAPAGRSAASIAIRTGTMSQAAFDDLNARLNAGGVYGNRSVEVAAGDLAINNDAGGHPLVTARSVTIATDSGNLAVNGTINASGPAPGSIRLSAGGNLTIAGGGVLDAHGSVLQVDSTGAPIAADNAGTVELTVADSAGGRANAGVGVLTLQPGATINLATADGVARGDIELNVRRAGGATGGSLAIAAPGPLAISGAGTIAVNGFWTYVPADGTVVQYQANDPTGIGLDTVDQASRGFIAAAAPGGQLNPALAGTLGGLTANAAAFHLRPGVEIDSATPAGNLTVQGDLDLSQFRYGPGVAAAVPGAGEPGVLVLRAGGNLNIYGSISDGFAHPPVTPDDNYFVLYSGGAEANGQTVVLPAALTLTQAQFSNATPAVLNYPITVTTNALQAGTVLPVGLTLSAALPVPASVGGFVATAPITSKAGAVLYAAGAIVPAGTLAAGDVLSPGFTLPVTTPLPTAGIVWPGGASLQAFTGSIINARAVAVPAGGLIPAGTVVILSPASTKAGSGLVCSTTSCTLRRAIGTGQQAGREDAIAPLLPAGDLSWSLRLVAGGDLGAADTRALQPQTVLAAQATPTNPAPGSVILSDLHYMAPQTAAAGATAREVAIFSVVRTGTGTLDLLAGGNINEQTLYGIYTAGTQSAGIIAADNAPRAALAGGATVLGVNGKAYESLVNGSATSLYQANYPTAGGNVLVGAQGSIAGDIVAYNANTTGIPDSNAVGNWLWRQGGNGTPTAWWINYGTYVVNPVSSSIGLTAASYASQYIYVAGFTGIGALGGGNVTVTAGGDAGYTTYGAGVSGGVTAATSGLDIAVGGTGRVSAAGLTQTGGGTLSLQVGGRLNPAYNGNSNDVTLLGTDLNGTLTDLRGSISVSAGSIGLAVPEQSPESAADPRLKSPYVAEGAQAEGGPVVVIGDGDVSLSARGDVVLSGVADPTRQKQQNSPALASWFSLWTPRTAVELFAAGGNAVPIVEGASAQTAVTNSSINAPATDNRYVYPPSLSVVAASGNIYVQAGTGPSIAAPTTTLELAPSPSGQLALLAAGSIYDVAGGAAGHPVAFDLSGASTAVLPTPFSPAYTDGQTGSAALTNTAASADTAALSLFTYGPDTVTDSLHAGSPRAALFYAVGGDILDLLSGETLTSPLSRGVDTIAATPVRIEAGRDIIATGTPPGTTVATPAILNSAGDLFLNVNPTDVSELVAGRDIIYANATVDGPGLLYVQAGRNLYQGNQGLLQSGGPLVNINAATRNGGAGITVLAGVGADGPNWSGFANAYLITANLADPLTPLQDQPGKVERSYGAQLLSYLQQGFGYTGTAAGALAAFGALPAEQQHDFLLQIYFSELGQSGLDYNNSTGRFYHSYLEGDRAIATLFPTTDLTGQAAAGGGGITLFGGSGIRTDYGGAVQLVVPAGAITLGVAGSTTPPATAGLLTQGSGDIDIYSYGSVELGQSRVFTTFGGDILIWMASNGEINAGRGATSTVVFSPAQISYGSNGAVTLSPTVPSTGAGIATLAPIASVPAGSINLIAPVGTIDAGEAGIRSSGNANLAALTVVNASNIQSQGRTSGLPVIAVPNVAAAAAASATAAAAQNAAQQQNAQAVGNAAPQSTITVEVTGFGGS